MKTLLRRLVLSLAALAGVLSSARADAVYHALASSSFTQNWSDASLLVTNDDWSGVPSIIGYRGDDLTSTTGTNPQTITGEGTPVVDVNVNQTSPNTYTTGGVTEFALTDPVVALAGSGTADAPYLQIHLNTTGASGIVISYKLRDLDGSTDDAIQQIALQYRVGTTGNFTDIPTAYVADATTGPSLATLDTLVSVNLPAAAENQAQVQLRILTTNASGNDEWVGIDDISIVAGGTVTPTAPAVASVAPASGSANVSTTSTFAVTFNQPVNVATGWFSLLGSTSGNLTAGVVVSGGPTTFTLTPGTAFTYSETATLTLNAAFITSQATSANPAANTTATYTIAPPPGSATAINSIQGTSDNSPLNGQSVTVQGIVTGFFFSTAGVRQGFYLQAPDSAVDTNPLTSEGLYVYFGTSPSFTSALSTVAAGDAVTVSGTVLEYKGTTDTTTLTELTTITGLTVNSSGNPLPAAIPVTLPFSSLTYLERLEGMRVTFPQTLYVTDTFGLGRYGEVELSSGGILPQPTNVAAPGTAALLQQTANNLNRIILDDTIAAQNPDPTPYLFGGATSTENTLRGGDTLVELTGVVTNIASLWMIQPTATPLFERENPRSAPPAVGGNLKVVGFNVLNYFNGFGLPNGLADSDNRGANNSTELDRQRAHIITSLAQLDADIYGLTELQNNGFGPSSAIQDLLDRLNAATTNGSVYALVNPGASYPQIGTDAITCGFLYKTNTVALTGITAINTATTFSRPAIAQTFKKLSNGEKLTVSINHFKSKGSSGASGLDADQNDGQGAYNNRRTLQAQALTAWLATFPTGDPDPDILIIGDLNAYAKEDPITAIENAGYTNLTELYEGPTGYSYSFDGQWGHLDHALGTATLTAQVNSAQAWHSNADEPIVLDYNQEFKTTAQQLINAGNTPWRSSDHDPIVVGLKLYSPIEAWRVTYFNSPANTGSASDDSDYDGDGLNNLLEYGLGLDPKTPSATGRPTLAVADGVATFSFARARSELSYIVQSTENLAVPSSWTDTQINPGSVGQTVPVNVTIPSSGRLFLRLKITQPSP